VRKTDSGVAKLALLLHHLCRNSSATVVIGCHGEEEMARKPGVPAVLPASPRFFLYRNSGSCPWREVKISGSPGISVDKNTDERDLMDYLTFPQALIANPFNPANPLFFTSFINTVFPREPDF
jgi:hypothetical protein